MAFQYFLYRTDLNNTLVDRSNTSFAPLPPNTDEIFIDFFIPRTQPLYFYRESGGEIILNSQENIDEYIQETTTPEADDFVTRNELNEGLVLKVNVDNFNNYSGDTDNRFNLIEDITDIALTGITNLGTGTIIGNIDGRNTTLKSISVLGNLTLSGDVNNIIISGGSGAGSVAWGDIGGNISNQTDLQNALNNKLDVSDFNTYSGNTLTNIQSRLLTSDFNTYSGNTLTNIQSRLLTSDFNTYSGTTAPNTFVNIDGDTMTGALNIQANLTVGDGIDNTLFVDSTNDIVYLGDDTLSGLVAADNLSLYTEGRIALGNSATIGRLRGNTPGNVPRALSLIDTNAVVRVWRFTDDAVDPAVEFVWGVGDTPSSAGNAWWDMYLDGAASPDDSFAIRRRSDGNVEKLRLTTNTAIIPMTTSSTSPTTGALTVAGGVGIAGATNLAGLARYSTDLSASYDDRTLVDKEYVDTLPLTVLNTTSAGSTTTTSTAYVLQTGMQIANVPAGTYLVGYGNYFSHNTNNASIFTSIFVGGTAQTGSEMRWNRGGGPANITTTHNYSNFLITLASTQTVEIRWRTSTGTATSTNRYLTLLKVSSIT